MGSFRRRLTALLAFAPSGALAQTCSDMRPGWDGAPVGAVAEAVQLFMTPGALVLILASAIALRMRSQWGVLAVVIGWTIIVSLLTLYDTGDGARALARTEGCVGSPTLFILVVAAICGAMILMTAPRIGAEPDPGDD